jgi:hypothetical protein
MDTNIKNLLIILIIPFIDDNKTLCNINKINKHWNSHIGLNKLLKKRHREIVKEKGKQRKLKAKEHFKKFDDSLLNVVGAIALSIRDDWSDPFFNRCKVEKMKEILKHFNNRYLYQIYKLDSSIYDILEDGRWMRDEWDGPYGYDKKLIIEKHRRKYSEYYVYG